MILLSRQKLSCHHWSDSGAVLLKLAAGDSGGNGVRDGKVGDTATTALFNFGLGRGRLCNL